MSGGPFGLVSGVDVHVPYSYILPTFYQFFDLENEKCKSRLHP